MTRHPFSKASQQGATLIVALIFLVIIMAISLSGIQGTALEERMASNTRDRNQAFQAAETGLREAEQYIDNLAITTQFGSTAGLLSDTDSEPDFFDSGVWVDATSIEVTTGLKGLSAPPRYIIQLIAEETADTDETLSIDGYGERLAGESATIFLITSRGVGGSSNAQIVLQTHYGKRF